MKWVAMKSMLSVRPRAAVALAAAVFCAALLFQGSTAAAGPISPGFDLYQTPPPVLFFGSDADFSTNPLPAGFFGPGSDPFSGFVSLVGAPLGGSFPGNSDTIVQRTGSLADGVSGTVPIEIVALNLVSLQSITVTYGSDPPKFWDLHINLPTAPPQPTGGSMNVQHNDPDGGTFTGTLPIRPLFTFTEVGNPSNQNSLEINDSLQFVPFSIFIFSFEDEWSHSPSPLDAHNATWPAGDFYAGVLPPDVPRSVWADGTVLDLLMTPATAPEEVPEPSTWLLAALGAAGLAAFARRRRR